MASCRLLVGSDVYGSPPFPARARRPLREHAWTRLRPQLTRDESAAARRIVTALGQDTEATLLAATYVREFHLALPALADELQHPHAATLRMTAQPLQGSALLVATAIHRGQLQRDRNDSTEAERCFRWASERAHALRLRALESLALVLLGRLAQVQERLDDAEHCYAQALPIDRELGNRHDEGVDLGLLAQVAWLSGMYDDAERLAQQAAILHRQARDGRSAATTFLTLGEVARERGHRWRAQLYFFRAKLAQRGFV